MLQHQVIRETMWLVENPDFERRPATIREFLQAPYLDILDGVRPGVLQALEEIFGREVNSKRMSPYERALFTGGVGVGKTTFASIILPYMTHWVLCLKDPQKFYGLLPGSRVTLMQMSTSRTHARDVIFSDIKARINNSQWFREFFPYDPKHQLQLRFPKSVVILPGDSAETTFEGHNILGGVLDEGDSHKLTADKDYAQEGFNTIESRISSRFVDNTNSDYEGHLGLVIVIGQMKKAHGFMARKYKEMTKDPRAKVVRMSIWESFGWDKYMKEDGVTRNSFFYDSKRKQIIPDAVAGMVQSDTMIEVPRKFLQQFKNNPEKALRDLAGIPPQAKDAFISLAERVYECRDRWIERHGDESPVSDSLMSPKFADWFRSSNDPRRRTIHIDLGISGDGDALGMAMGHIESIVEIDGEKKPYIVIDMILRMKAAPGSEIMISDVRRIVYDLKDEYGFRVKKATMDGFQSSDSMQQFRKRRMEADYVSVDKTTLPYEDLREAIYERRIEFPPYLTYRSRESTERYEPAIVELLQLQHDGKKVDHPPNGAKDVADALAGVCYSLMGDRNFRKGVIDLNRRRSQKLESTGTDDATAEVQEEVSPFAASGVPQNPYSIPQIGQGLGFMVPKRLRPRG